MSNTSKRLEQAIATALSKSEGVSETRIRLTDAATVARMVVRTWGDQAPEILEQAAELARQGR